MKARIVFQATRNSFLRYVAYNIARGTHIDTTIAYTIGTNQKRNHLSTTCTYLQHERDNYVTVDDHLEVLRRQKYVNHALGLIENQRVNGQQHAYCEYHVGKMWTTSDHELSDRPQVDRQPATPFWFTPRVYTAPNEHAPAKYTQTHLKWEKKMRITANNHKLVAVTIYGLTSI